MGLKTDLEMNFLKIRHRLKKGSPYFKNKSIFENKKIIIVGPATSSLNYLSGNQIDQFDFIVRINSGIIVASQMPEVLGSRTDVLFHCATPCGRYGLEALSETTLKNQNVKFVFHPHARKKSARKFYRLTNKNPYIPFWKTEDNLWHEVHKEQTAKEPTTGLMALVYFLRMNLAELHITGFTFYRTNYIDAYANSNSREVAIDRMENFTVHNPEEDFARFVKEYKEALELNKNVLLDVELEEIVKQSNEVGS